MRWTLGSQTRIYDFFARTVEKMRGSRVFVIQCYKFLLYFIVVRNKNLQGLKKRREGNGKFTQ